MTDFFYLFLVILLLIAAFLGEDFTLTLVYLLLGALAAGRWWSRRALRAVSVRRAFTPRAFLGETVKVRLELANRGWLPLPWLHLRESLPAGMAHPPLYSRVLSLGAQAGAVLDYELLARKRGLYPVGPLNLTSGDLLGMAAPIRLAADAGSLVVFPKIIPLTRLPLVSRSPVGTLPHRQPLFEDPARPRGKREYTAGDSQRKVDWKATAATGRLQVKQFEPSIALEAALFLNLNGEEYDYRTRIDVTELAIVVAASMAYWVISRRQSVGLATNGTDSLNGETPPPMQPGRGRAHLMRLLELLARIQAGAGPPFAAFLSRERVHFSWGTTLLVITGQVDRPLFDGLFAARRAGLDAMLVAVGRGSVSEEDRRRAKTFGFPLALIQSERDLDQWRV